MQRRALTALGVAVLVVLAGCTGLSGQDTTAPATDEQQSEPGSESADSQIVTHRNETEDGMLFIRADTGTESYKLQYNATANISAEDDSDLEVGLQANFSLNFMCGIYKEMTYNYSQLPEDESEIEDPKSLNLTQSEGMFEGTPLPDNLFATYEADSVQVRVYDRDKSKLLGQCSIPNVASMEKELFVD